jgi:hypothetical protein
MSDELAQQRRREACRAEVRAYLAPRNLLAFDVPSIRRSLQYSEGADFTEGEISSALAFLIGLGQAREIPEELGSTKRFKITTNGVLAHERRP